jgi:para-nitrobenzyl esterase
MLTTATRLGKIRGVEADGVTSFFGLRYGEPPTGRQRFLAPAQASGWHDVFEATAYPNRSMQNKSVIALRSYVAGEVSEDCLFLNLTTPALTGKCRPVLVWIHGGGFVTGSANEYDTAVLSRQGDMVVVSLNFRLGTLAFLDLSSHGPQYGGSACNGLRDIILALQWVRDNIDEYGGDPQNVTIAGQSSGATMVLGLLAAPEADSLYHKAIANSPTCAYFPAEDQSDKIAQLLAVSHTDVLATLLAMPAQEIVDLERRYRLTVDGTVITRPTFDAIVDRGNQGVPLLIGSNLNEGTLYTQGLDAAQDHYPDTNILLAGEMLCGADTGRYLTALQQYYPKASPGKFHELVWNDMFRRIAMRAAELTAAAGLGAWLYRFDLPANLPRFKDYGASHASEMAFTFNTIANPNTHAVTFHDPYDPIVKRVAEQWVARVIQFCASGQPNGVGLENWPCYEAVTRGCLVIDQAPKIIADPDRQHRRLWEQ